MEHLHWMFAGTSFAGDARRMTPFRSPQPRLETLERTNGGPDCAICDAGDGMCDDD
jgi:hypothetical protein